MFEIESPSIWILVGLLLLIGEMLSATFFMIFVALGSFAAAFVASLGFDFEAQSLVASATSILGILLLRKPIQRRLLKSINISVDVGKEISAELPIAPGAQTRLTYQGTSWQATNLDSTEIKKGETAVIVGIDGNTLLIRRSH